MAQYGCWAPKRSVDLESAKELRSGFFFFSFFFILFLGRFCKQRSDRKKYELMGSNWNFTLHFLVSRTKPWLYACRLYEKNKIKIKRSQEPLSCFFVCNSCSVESFSNVIYFHIFQQWLLYFHEGICPFDSLEVLWLTMSKTFFISTSLTLIFECWMLNNLNIFYVNT